MGNTSSSKDRHGEETVDFGYLTPQGGIYPSAQRDWNHPIVAQLIVHRKLAPFYRPLEDYEDDWEDEQILAAQKKPPAPNQQDGSSTTSTNTNSMTNGSDDAASISSGGGGSSNSHVHLTSATSALRHAASKSSTRSASAPHKELAERNLEARLYRGAVDCPICFLVRIISSPFLFLFDSRVSHLISPTFPYYYCLHDSTTHLISTTRDAAIRPSAANASYISNEQTQRRRISSRNLRAVRTACRVTLELSILHRTGGRV